MRTLEIHSLPNSDTWIDRDVIMLHSCFQILKNAVDKEGVDTHCNYEAHKETIDEIRFLYKWWEKRSKNIFNDKDKDEKEDTEMLDRLMKVRTFLWT